MLKRKRDESGEEGEVFRTNKKTVRFPDVERGREEGIEKTMRRLRREELMNEGR